MSAGTNEVAWGRVAGRNYNNLFPNCKPKLHKNRTTSKIPHFSERLAALVCVQRSEQVPNCQPPFKLQLFMSVCYTRVMRNWMRERMKRRKKKQENETEATGKVGQQKPPVDELHPEPIVPAYESNESEAPEPEPEVRASAFVPEENRMETEIQPDQPSVPAPEQKPIQASKGARPPKGVVVLAIGLPGSGKSTWFRRRGVTPLSSDMLRSILFDDITEQRYQGLVFSTLRSLLRARLIARMPWNYVDASNLSSHERRQWIKMAKGFGYEVNAVFFDVPLEVCLERNRKRERQVKEELVQRMAAKLKAPTFEEGFSKITVVRVKKPAGSGQEAAEY